MRYVHHQVTLSEIPGHLMMALSISGCPLRCEGCHSPELWNPRNGKELHLEQYDAWWIQYGDHLDGICFLGGDHDPELITHLEYIKRRGWLTALYTGAPWEGISPDIKVRTDFIKCGPYVQSLGGLDSPTTNQYLLDLRTNQYLLGNKP